MLCGLRGALGCGDDAVDILALTAFWILLVEQFSIAADSGEHVVEVVCNSTCQAPNGLQLLGLSKLQLEAAAAASGTAAGGETAAPPQATAESLSDDNSIDIDDLDNYNYENGDHCQQMVDVIIGAGGSLATTTVTSSQYNSLKSCNKDPAAGLNNNEKQRIAELEDIVKKLSTELGDLKDKLKQEAEKVTISSIRLFRIK